MLKRLKTHHLFRRVPLLSLSTNHQTLWKNPQRRRGGGAQAIGSGDNRRRQIAFLIRSFINPRTRVEGIICNTATSSRFLLALSRVTVHLSLYSKQEREKNKENAAPRAMFQTEQAAAISDFLFYPHYVQLIPSHVMRQDLTSPYKIFTREQEKSASKEE